MADGPYSVDFVPGARRQLAKLPRGAQQQVSRAIDRLARQPRSSAAKLLSDGRRVWRIRVGDYRVLYHVHDDRLVVLVIRVAHRREAYR